MINYSEINKRQTVSEEDPFTVQRYQQFSRFFNLKNENISILDVGCNTGRGGAIFREKSNKANIIGVDIVQERLDQIPAGIYNMLLCESIIEISLPSSSMDYVVAGEVIEHIAPEDLNKVLISFNRVLKPNGKLLMTTPNPNSFLIKLGRDSVFNDPSHLSIMTIKRLKTLLKGNGFTDIKIVGSGKAIDIFPDWFPIMGVFGSYLSIALKDS
jgi:SAM-dependent methyltransferase